MSLALFTAAISRGAARRQARGRESRRSHGASCAGTLLGAAGWPIRAARIRALRNLGSINFGDFLFVRGKNAPQT